MNKFEDSYGGGKENERTKAMEELQDDYYKKRVPWLEAILKKKQAEQASHQAIEAFLKDRNNSDLRAEVERTNREINLAQEEADQLVMEMNKVGDAIVFASEDDGKFPTVATRNVEAVYARIRDERPDLAAAIRR